MRKLFVDNANKTLTISGGDYKHFSLVLRCRPGDEVTVCTGDGYDYLYVVESVTKAEILLKQTKKIKNLSEPFVRLTLFSAVCKGDKNDLIVRSCTELGVAEFQPILTEFTTAGGASYKTERLQKIAEEAAKQSGRGKIPSVSDPVAFDNMLNSLLKYDLVVFPYERADKDDIKAYLKKYFLDKPDVCNIAVIIGSEGGFSKVEVEQLKNAGAVPLTLGKRILRADTACAAVCSVVLYEAGEMK